MNFQELLKEIENRFWCMNGPKLAYFEMDLNPPHLTWRLVYKVLNIGTIGRGPEAEARVCSAVLETLPDRTPEQKQDNIQPLLFWRRTPELGVQYHSDDLDPETGVLLVSNPRYITTVRMRLVIPGRDLESNEGKLTLI
jgi:hypothetical protein